MANQQKKLKKCWTLTDGKAGMRSQVQGLSEALGMPVEHKTCVRSKWLSLLPVRWTQFFLGLKSGGDNFEAPWPDLLIASGRRSIPLALHVRRKSKGKTFVVYTQDPRINPSHFDFVIAMDHDKVEGDNVKKISMALNGVTQEKLKDAAARYKKKFETYKKPFCAIMIGGSTHSYTMTDEVMDCFIQELRKLLESFKGALLITPSRRTSALHVEKIITAFKDEKRVFVADLTKDNPYYGFLGLADFFIVTDDSVNMMSECCATSKTVYVYNLKGHEKTKAKKFSQKLISQNKAFLFDGTLKKEKNTYENETQKMANFLRDKLIRERGFSSDDFKGTV